MVACFTLLHLEVQGSLPRLSTSINGLTLVGSSSCTLDGGDSKRGIKMEMLDAADGARGIPQNDEGLMGALWEVYGSYPTLNYSPVNG